MNEYQESQTKNISLIDLIFYCLEKWRYIVVCMLLVAVMAGLYKYQVTVKGNQMAQKGTISKEEGREDDISQQSIEFYEQAIKEVEYDLEIQQDYMENSVVMQLDPYHIFTGNLSYYVEAGENTDNVIAAYSTFISSGRMAEALYTDNQDVRVEDLRYLISFNSSRNDKVLRMGDDGILSSFDMGEAIFQIQVRMPDSDLSGEYLECAEKIMTQYTSQLQTEVAQHKLTLLTSVQSEMTDSDIQEYQSAMRSAYTASVRNLQMLQNEFETIQGTQVIEEKEDTSVVVKNPSSAAVKFAVLGLILGAFIACFVLLIMYMLGGKLQDTENFKEEFGMPLLGMIRVSGQKRKLFGFIDTWIFRLRGGSYAKVSFEEQIKIAAVNIQTAIAGDVQEGEKKKIMLSGTIPVKDAEELCMKLAVELPEVSLSSYKQIVFQSSALKEVYNYDGILFLERRGSSNSGFITQERKLAMDRCVKVLGTVVVC